MPDSVPSPRAFRSPGTIRPPRPSVVRLAWLACAVVLAFGAAGLVTGMDHPPGSSARAELTWAADQAIEPGLEAAIGDLQKLSTDVDSLGVLGRGAISAIVAGSFPALTTAIGNGQALVTTIDTETAALRAKLAALPGVGPGIEERLSGPTLVRYQTLTGALDATHGLGNSWAQLSDGSVAAIQIQTALQDHDRLAGLAVRSGTGGKYAVALGQLDQASAALTTAKGLRDRMANTIDVTVLSQWIDANDGYDAALRTLYSLLKASHGTITDPIVQAFAAERAAQKLLPGDTRGLVVIMADVAQGGMDQAVIEIEKTKAGLAAALDALAGGEAAGTGGSPNPSASP